MMGEEDASMRVIIFTYECNTHPTLKCFSNLGISGAVRIPCTST